MAEAVAAAAGMPWAYKARMMSSGSNGLLEVPGPLTGGVLNRFLTLELTLTPSAADGIPDDTAADIFAAAAEAWMAAGVRSVLLTLPASAARLVPLAQAAQLPSALASSSSSPSSSSVAPPLFKLHHASPENNTITLGAWLRDSPNSLPLYATHSVGCGGLVLGPDETLLVVREHGDLRDGPDARPSQWKLPGGAADVGEDLHAAAVREVYEETGVETEPVGLMAVRQLHGFRFGIGDIYFVFALRLKDANASLDAHQPLPCPNELYDAAWLPIRDYAAIESLSPMNRAVADALVAALDTDSLNVWELSRLHYTQPPVSGAARSSIMFMASL
ncbi:uncharacterized protein AMSG_10885 [Thecamonas trahens ATCC 50062]|uniref:Nudix hydrolase domain-containing protein n=1 Tax=Thecamonas trahens ATCC 50062 TaxID=461836 RepID=A0A0L0DT86_THETB|nr:hypothetical protein AMSG_10885 [Thecamonas trahens ATCC 50062]KNC55251.1 hypothetical protein AMSG_10885 [Thecamonas trahens ATCC 50062]|eukprot:XP_013753180.1 hypothetical protein AMSG_10885 [Thecamonas trahens ATCC 50062]